MKPGFASRLYIFVLVGVLAGIVFGIALPTKAAAMKPLSDLFIAAIKIVVVPVVFCTIASGFARQNNLFHLGRVSIKAFIYFEVISTLALIIGLAIVNLLKPGASVTAASATVAANAKPVSSNLFLSIIHTPILQGLFLGIVTGLFLSRSALGSKATTFFDHAIACLYRIVTGLMFFAPVAAFGAMSFTVGTFGVSSIGALVKLMACFYFACILFVFVILGILTRWAGLSIFSFVRYISDEIFIVLGTSSSETALPRLIHKLEKLGVPPSIAGLVVPAGYSFNLDGTSIYLTMGAVFIAQATHTPLTLGQQIATLTLLIITSKGAAGVTGSGFATLAASINAGSPIPVSGLSMLVGVDRFMSEARAITNLIGNGVAALVIAHSENQVKK